MIGLFELDIDCVEGGWITDKIIELQNKIQSNKTSHIARDHYKGHLAILKGRLVPRTEFITNVLSQKAFYCDKQQNIVVPEYVAYVESWQYQQGYTYPQIRISFSVTNKNLYWVGDYQSTETNKIIYHVEKLDEHVSDSKHSPEVIFSDWVYDLSPYIPFTKWDSKIQEDMAKKIYKNCLLDGCKLVSIDTRNLHSSFSLEVDRLFRANHEPSELARV